jgi:antitoxin component YwqK of YwqJK toxin-antitoxin module
MSLDKIKEKCQNYLEQYIKKYSLDAKTSFVYKFCGNHIKETIIVMQKLSETRDNEIRVNIYDSNFAKFRASHLLVVLILDINNPDIEYESTDNRDFEYTLYEKEKIVYPDSFDPDLDKICSNGIHYFKSIDAAFYFAIYHKKNQNYSGKVIYCNDDGRKYQEGNYINGQKNGVWTQWNEYGEITNQGDYLNDKENGIWTHIWYVRSEGRKLFEIEYLDGDKNGKYIEYYPNGKKCCETAYLKDKQNGKRIQYHDNGKKELETYYEDDLINGIQIEWFRDGQKATVSEYLKGKLNGKFTNWYSNGQKHMEGKFLNNEKVGKWTNWSLDGESIKEEEYK